MTIDEARIVLDGVASGLLSHSLEQITAALIATGDLRPFSGYVFIHLHL
jgi:hypothetical protein